MNSWLTLPQFRNLSPVPSTEITKTSSTPTPTIRSARNNGSGMLTITPANIKRELDVELVSNGDRHLDTLPVNHRPETKVSLIPSASRSSTSVSTIKPPESDESPAAATENQTLGLDHKMASQTAYPDPSGINPEQTSNSHIITSTSSFRTIIGGTSLTVEIEQPAQGSITIAPEDLKAKQESIAVIDLQDLKPGEVLGFARQDTQDAVILNLGHSDSTWTKIALKWLST